MEEKEICYPFAYGRINASLDWLTSNLEMDCIREGVEVDDKVIELLKKRIEKIQKVAVEESYDKH
tara:strand:+ start:360 stop:554 length:195 start_codon:yes stop_codon:yes gene_type:complete